MKTLFYLFPFSGLGLTDIAQKMKFSIMIFFSKCDQIGSFLRIWSHLLKKSLMENIFVQCDPKLRTQKYIKFN